MALNIRKVVSDRGLKTEGLCVVQGGEGHAANTDAGGKVHEAVAEDAEVGIGKEQSGEAL